MNAFARTKSDAQFYCQLKYPDNDFRTGLWRTALTSKGFWLLVLQRIGYYADTNKSLTNPLWWIAITIEYLSIYLFIVVAKSEIRYDCDFQGRVYLSDHGYLILGPQLVGDGTLIHDHVTAGFGVASGSRERPIIGKNVWIGPDCVIAGALTIGDGATLLPGTIVTLPVAPNTVVAGNPAKVLRRNYDNSKLRQSLHIYYSLPEDANA